MIDAEEGARTARFINIPNLHVFALWITNEEGGDRFYVDYRFQTKDPIPETMGIDQFLSFVGELAAAKAASYERSRKWAIERGLDPNDLVG